jgi:general secretion pathway protein G
MKPASLASHPGLRRAQRAFTLLEILVVLAIIGLLVTLAVGNFRKSFDDAKIDVAKLFVGQSLGAPLMSYKMHMGDYPSTSEGLQSLATPPANHAERWRGPYITDNKLPLDPWGEPYQYRYPGTKNKSGYDLWSKGPDKADGTEDDIGNWSKE